MGEIAEQLIKFTPHRRGYSIKVSKRQSVNISTKCSQLNGLKKYLALKYSMNEKQINKCIRTYAKEQLDFEGSLKQCAIQIQYDFGAFKDLIALSFMGEVN